jgi:negative regulator of flagellin synthesis FlgM
MVSDIKGYNTRDTSATRQGPASGVRAERSVEQSSAGGIAPPARDDTVALSGLPGVIKTTAARLAAEPAVDEARVRNIKDALARGEYEIDPERIARKLIDSDNL